MGTDKHSTKPRQTILYIDHSPKMGGASRVIVNLLKEIDHQRIKPVVVCPESSDLKRIFREQNLSVTPAFMPWFTKQSNPLTWCVYLYAVISFAFFLKKLIRRNNVGLVHANGFIAALYSIIPARSLKVPLIWHAHEILDLGFINAFFVKMAGRNVDKIICVSEAVKKRLIEFGVDADKCVVLYNFVPEPIDSVGQRFDFLSDYNIPKEARIIGMIGNISAMKGQKIFLEAIRKISEKHPRVFYFIVGDTLSPADEPYKQELVRTLQTDGLDKKIILTGYRRDAFQILKRFDFLVHPVTLPDSLPLVIQEAMYLGKPVIASNIGGIPEMIADGLSGFLVQPGDSSRLAEVIDELLKKPDLCSSLGREGKKILFVKFSRDVILKKLERIYSKFFLEN